MQLHNWPGVIGGGGGSGCCSSKTGGCVTRSLARSRRISRGCRACSRNTRCVTAESRGRVVFVLHLPHDDTARDRGQLMQFFHTRRRGGGGNGWKVTESCCFPPPPSCLSLFLFRLDQTFGKEEESWRRSRSRSVNATFSPLGRCPVLSPGLARPHPRPDLLLRRLLRGRSCSPQARERTSRRRSSGGRCRQRSRTQGSALAAHTQGLHR